MKCLKCKSENIKKFGKVKTRKRSKRIQRFKCKDCNRTFTKRNFLPEYREKRPDLSKKIQRLYLEGVTLRGLARYLKCDYRTVVRKFIKYSHIAMVKNRKQLVKNKTKCHIIQIDEMHT